MTSKITQHPRSSAMGRVSLVPRFSLLPVSLCLSLSLRGDGKETTVGTRLGTRLGNQEPEFGILSQTYNLAQNKN